MYSDPKYSTKYPNHRGFNGRNYVLHYPRQLCLVGGCLSKQLARSKDRWLAGGGSAQTESSTEAQIS